MGAERDLHGRSSARVQGGDYLIRNGDTGRRLAAELDRGAELHRPSVPDRAE
jgi:hypothetical protein